MSFKYECLSACACVGCEPHPPPLPTQSHTPYVLKVRVSECLLGCEACIRVICTELSDEVNASSAAMFEERSNTTARGGGEGELHVTRLTAGGKMGERTGGWITESQKKAMKKINVKCTTLNT